MEKTKELQPLQYRKFDTASTYDPLLLQQMKVDTINNQQGELKDYDCAACKNRGFIAKLRGLDPVMVECDCMGIRRCIRKMEASGLKHVIREMTFDSYQAEQPWQETVKQGAMAYAADPQGWFLLSGQSGAGKTHLCTAICRKLLYDGRKVRYMSWREEVGRLKSLALEHDARQSLLEELKKAEVLYIDDLFKGGTEQEGAKPTAADGSLAFEILNYREHNRLPTILSTEKTEAELLQIDTAIGSRILHRSGAHTYIIGKDPKKNYRLRNMPKNIR